MKRDKLESYLGKYVKIILFDGTAIKGTLHKTGEKAFENDPDLSMPKQRYFCTDENGFISSRCLFRVSHIKTLALAKMTNFKKIKSMGIDEMARSCMEFFSCPYGTPYDPPYIYCDCEMGKKFKYNCIDCTKHWLESEADSD